MRRARAREKERERQRRRSASSAKDVFEKMRDTQSIKSTQTKHTFSQTTNKTKACRPNLLSTRLSRPRLQRRRDTKCSFLGDCVCSANIPIGCVLSRLSIHLVYLFCVRGNFPMRASQLTFHSFSLFLSSPSFIKRRAGSAETIHR